MRTVVKWIISIVALVIVLEFFVMNYFSKRKKTARKNPVLNGQVVPRDELLDNHFAISQYENILEQQRLQRVLQVSNHSPSSVQERIDFHVACVICGNRARQALIMLKSIIIFNSGVVKFYIFVEDHLRINITDTLDSWPAVKSQKASYKMYPITFPEGNNQVKWKTLFKPCAAQRLFLPSLLHDVDSVIYLDTDTLLLTDIGNIWEMFKKFNSTQLAGMTKEGEVPALNWYKRFAQHPFYGQLGVNSGVMLMNLTRIRNNLKWNEEVLSNYKNYHLKLTWGDQDILNIMFHKFPECLFLFTCDLNYRPDHCMYGNNCPDIKSQGISVIHGNRGVFHNDKHPVFKAVFESFEEFNFSDFSLITLSTLMEKKFNSLPKSYCSEVTGEILFLIEKEYAERTL